MKKMFGLAEMGVAITLGLKPPSVEEILPTDTTDQPYKHTEYGSTVLIQFDQNQQPFPLMTLKKESDLSISGIKRILI